MGQSLSVIGMWGSCVQENTAHCNSKQARFHNTETLCEAIISQKHFVKKRNQNIQNLEKKNIYIFCQTFSNLVLTLCSLLIKTKQISFIIKLYYLQYF
jgi:hypothetical protein